MTAISVQDLPYDLPSNPKSQLKVLAKIIGIKPELIQNGGEDEIIAITGTILYRHLDRLSRMRVMEKIRSLKSRPLQGKLITLALDTTFVNPQWGMWSLSNDELMQDAEFHQALEDYASMIGITVSALGIKDLLLNMKNSWNKPAAWLPIVAIWGCLSINSGALKETNEELKRRIKTEIRGSRFY